MKGQLRAETGESGLGVAEAYLAQFGVVNKVGAVPVDESTEGQAILPAGQREVGCGRQAWVQAAALSYPCPRSTPIRMASSVKWSKVQTPWLGI